MHMHRQARRSTTYMGVARCCWAPQHRHVHSCSPFTLRTRKYSAILLAPMFARSSDTGTSMACAARTSASKKSARIQRGSQQYVPSARARSYAHTQHTPTYLSTGGTALAATVSYRSRAAFCCHKTLDERLGGENPGRHNPSTVTHANTDASNHTDLARDAAQDTHNRADADADADPPTSHTTWMPSSIASQSRIAITASGLDLDLPFLPVVPWAWRAKRNRNRAASSTSTSSTCTVYSTRRRNSSRRRVTWHGTSCTTYVANLSMPPAKVVLPPPFVLTLNMFDAAMTSRERKPARNTVLADASVSRMRVCQINEVQYTKCGYDTQSVGA